MSDSEKILALVKNDALRIPIQKYAEENNYDVIWSVPVKGIVPEVSQLRPMIMLVDVAQPLEEWFDHVRALRSNPATRRLAILGFADGLTDAQRQQAANVHLEEIFDAKDSRRDKLLTTLPQRIKAHQREADSELLGSLQSPCQEKMPELVFEGITAFNSGEFYAAHDDLEAAWVAEDRVIRNLYQGILQVGVAYYQIQRENYWGAVKMFLRAFQWLEVMPDICHGIDVAQLKKDARNVWQTLEANGAENIADFDQSLFTQIKFDPTYRPIS